MFNGHLLNDVDHRLCCGTCGKTFSRSLRRCHTRFSVFGFALPESKCDHHNIFTTCSNGGGCLVHCIVCSWWKILHQRSAEEFNMQAMLWSFQQWVVEAVRRVVGELLLNCKDDRKRLSLMECTHGYFGIYIWSNTSTLHTSQELQNERIYSSASIANDFQFMAAEFTLDVLHQGLKGQCKWYW